MLGYLFKDGYKEGGGWDWRMVAFITITALLLSTYLTTTLRSNLSIRQSSDELRSPAIVPYIVPGLGNLFTFAFDTLRFITKARKSFGSIPFRVRVGTEKFIFISGPEAIITLFKQAREVDTSETQIRVVEKAFGTPKETRHCFERDNTGTFLQPLEGSRDLEPNNRIYYHQHRTLHQDLSGNGLAELARKFMNSLTDELNAVDIKEEWVEIPDFFTFARDLLFKASTTSLCGPHMLRLNPNLSEDFWHFDSLIAGMFKGLPRWMIPKSYQSRDKMKAALQKWHTHAKENFDWADESIAKTDWDEFYGGKIMRERNRIYRELDGFNEDAYAAIDLGMLWGANANSMPATVWYLIDTLLRPALLSQVLGEISLSQSSEKAPQTLSLQSLLSSPLLQSIYAEELRIRFAFLVTRKATRNDLEINGYEFPKSHMVFASTWHEHRDRNVWNEGPVHGELHPVEDFWAERFLIYPDDPTTGPRKPSSEVVKPKAKSEKKSVSIDAKAPKFTTDPVAGSWFPYGGGAKTCPGRFFAKQEVIGGMALFLATFDIELLRDENDALPEMDMSYYPFGVLPPKGKIPARMRRRKVVG